jgi:hypothetical protein
MSWKCFFGHKWEIVKPKDKKKHILEYVSAKLPINVYTYVYHKCKRCQELKINLVKGQLEK